MSSTEDGAPQEHALLERLLVDPAFRAAFRSAPVEACRAWGLSELAEELTFDRSLQTLEPRESKSSLAGVLMAAAAEGIGVVELTGLIGHKLHTSVAAASAVIKHGSSLNPSANTSSITAVDAAAGNVGPQAQPAVDELLSSSRLSLPTAVRTDLLQGTVDPRVISVLHEAIQHHTIVVGDLQSVSAPVPAQAIDIVSVDGEPVSAGNLGARDLVTEIAGLDPSVRPSEIGSPWPIQSQGFSSDASEPGELHLTFLEQETGGSTTASAAPAPATPAADGAAHLAGVELSTANASTPQPMALASLIEPAMSAVNPKVEAMVREADSLLGRPYVYGGGHAGWAPSSGDDCSGFVSAVLHAGGYLSQPVDTTALPDQPGILPGPGEWVTIYDRALPGQNGHVIIEINGQFYESGGEHGAWGGGGGVEKIGRPSAAYLATFPDVLHPAGL